MNYTRKAVTGVLWIAVGALVAQALGYALRLLLARSFTVEEFGLIYAVLAFFGLFGLFQSWGLNEAVTRFVAEALAKHGGTTDKSADWTGGGTATFRSRAGVRNVKEIVWIAAGVMYALSFLLALVTFLAADWLGLHYFKSGAAPTMVRLFAIGAFLNPIGILLPNLFLGYQRMDLRGAVEAAQSALILLGTALFLALGLGIRGAMAAYPFAFLLLHIIFLPVFFRLAPGILGERTAYRWTTVRKIFAYSIPMMLTGVASMILVYTDTALLTGMSTLTEVGLYQAAQPTARILLLAPLALVQALFPLVADIWAQGKKELVTASLHDLYSYSMLGALPLVIAFAAYPEIIINLLFGGEFVAAAPILLVLAFAALFQTVHAANVATTSGIGKPKLSTYSVGTAAVLNLVLNILLIPRYGSFGAAVATMVASAVMFLLGTLLIRRVLPVRLPLRRWAKTLLCGLIFWGVIVLLRGLFSPVVGLNPYLKTTLTLAAAGLAYVLALLLTRTVSIGEIQMLLERAQTRM